MSVRGSDLSTKRLLFNFPSSIQDAGSMAVITNKYEVTTTAASQTTPIHWREAWKCWQSQTMRGLAGITVYSRLYISNIPAAEAYSLYLAIWKLNILCACYKS